MAQRLVTHAARNSRGNIIAIGNPAEDWRQRRREWAILDILDGRHEYFVRGRRGTLRRIDVVNGASGRYLRAFPDAADSNNLDNLPALDLQPWEVAVEDAEILAVHAALVPHGAQGQVLLFGGNEHDPGNAEDGDIHNTRIYDVATNQIISVDSPPADAFCCGHAFLPDGRLLVGGGTSGIFPTDGVHFGHRHWSGARECAIYNLDGTWTTAARLQAEPGEQTRGGGRWYPTLLTLGDGRILAVGGHPLVHSVDILATDTRHGAWLPEVYSPAADGWSYQPGHWLYVAWDDLRGEALPEGQTQPESATARNNYLYYPRLFTVPDGRVFMASRNDGICGFYDPATGLMSAQGIDPPPHGATFTETNHTTVLLPLLPENSYTPSILFLGMDGAHRLTLEPAAETLAWQPTAPRDWPGTAPLRRHGCATLLPTGDVAFTGGINSTQGSGLSDSDGVRAAELYTPGYDWTSGALDPALEGWTTTPSAAVVRNYHSVALLLPNGRVLTAGGNVDGQSGGDSLKEYRIEIFCPAYDADPNRPQIAQAPASVSYGESFQFRINRADRVQRVALTRCGSVTHAWDGDQRYVGLIFTNPAAGVIAATAPPNGNVAPPGPYLLWAIDDAGRPCRLAPFVRLS